MPVALIQAMTFDPIADYMTPSPQTIEHDQPVESAQERMRALRVRHLPVTRDGEIVGLVSQRDLGLAARLRKHSTRRPLVGELMRDEPYTVGPNTPLGEVASHMATEKYGSAVILDRGEIAGIFTTVDACRVLADRLAAAARLGEYITAGPDTIGHHETVAMARAHMRHHALRHLPVMSSGLLVGILSARDLAMVSRFGLVDEDAVEVWQVMVKDVLTAGPRAAMKRMLRKMARLAYGSIVVQERGAVVGILTTIDVLRALHLTAPGAHNDWDGTSAHRLKE
jgi:acetoin utilization protein AcuB